MTTKKIDPCIELLKKPSQFVTQKSSTTFSLQCPSNFCVDKSNVKNDVKKPSDFFLFKEKGTATEEGVTHKSSLTLATPTEEAIDNGEHNHDVHYNFSTMKKISIAQSLQNNRSKIQSAQENILSNSKLLLSPIQLDPHLSSKVDVGVTLDHPCQNVKTNVIQHDAGTQANLKSPSDLKHSLENLRNENNRLTKRLEEADRIHFNEMKSVYDKYIALQTQFEDEKRFLMSKIVGLEQMLQESTYSKEQFDKHVQQLTLQNEYFKDCLTSETKRFNGVLHESESNVSILQLKLDKLEAEKLENLRKLESTTIRLTNSNKELHERSVLIDKLKIDLDTEIENGKTETKKCQEKYMAMKSALSNSEGKVESLKHENESVSSKLHEKEILICSLQKAIDDGQIQVGNAKKKIIEEQEAFKIGSDSKQREIEILQHTCKTLQTANETLNVRLNSLNEILILQESSLGEVVDKSKNEKLVRLWRQKVYSLLVLLKTYEMREHSKMNGNNLMKK